MLTSPVLVVLNLFYLPQIGRKLGYFEEIVYTRHMSRSDFSGRLFFCVSKRQSGYKIRTGRMLREFDCIYYVFSVFLPA